MRLFPAAEPCCSELTPLPPVLDSLPAVLQQAVERGLQRGFREMPPIATQPSPLVSPPFRHTSLNKEIALIIGSSPTIAGMQSIEDGLVGNITQVSGGMLPIVSKTAGFTATEQNTFLTVQAGDYERLHFSGVDFAVSSLDALLTVAFSVYVDGYTVLDRVRLGALRELSIDAPPKSVVRWKFALPSDLDVFLIYMTIKGYRYTCEGQGNYFSQLGLREDGQWQIPNQPCVPSRRALGAAEHEGACP